MSILIIPESVFHTVTSWAESCYPREGCGLIFGDFTGEGDKRSSRFVPLRNILTQSDEKRTSPVWEAATASLGARVSNQGRTEFVMDPEEVDRVSLAAQQEGLDLVGIVHTHPDHPAEPSATDRAQPMLAVWSNVIVQVVQGKYVELRSWTRPDDKVPFHEETIRIA
ncbi:MAG TPA: M67 family metallopeptidase [Elusimicrobiota bacterium]|nr:M67 family metallopeptidase [Elusimicrobiota bacterium]